MSNLNLAERIRSYAYVSTTNGGRTTITHVYVNTWWAALSMTVAKAEDIQQKSVFHSDGIATFTDAAMLDVRSVIRDEADGLIYKCVGLLPVRPSLGWIQMKVSLVNESQAQLAAALVNDPAPTW